MMVCSAYASVAVVASLVAPVQRFTGNTMVVGLVMLAIIFHCGEDADENPSLLGPGRC